MNEFNAVTAEEMTKVEGGFDWGLAGAIVGGLVVGGVAGAAVSAATYEVTKTAIK